MLEELINTKLYHFSDNILDNEFIIDNNYNSLIYYNLVDREILLEDIRKNKYSNLISRLHCLFLCDINSIRYWQRVLNLDYLYLLELNGISYCSYDRFIPKSNQDIDKAYEYWNNNLINGYDKEYLFQGNVKVLKRIL